VGRKRIFYFPAVCFLANKGVNPNVGLKGSFAVGKIWMEETASFWNL